MKCDRCGSIIEMELPPHRVNVIAVNVRSGSALHDAIHPKQDGSVPPDPVTHQSISMEDLCEPCEGYVAERLTQIFYQITRSDTPS
jgi:hypothetical protein